MAAVARAVDAAPLPPSPPELARFTRWVVSGVGASEGPARLLVGQLVELGLSARFLPVTSFLGADAPTADVLVVVSQRLSPNARIPLRHRARYRATVLVTSLDPREDTRARALAAEGATILQHGPPEEEGLILRVLGPALASRTVLHLAATVAALRGAPPSWTSRTGELGAAIARARDAAVPVDPAWVFGPSAILGAGDAGELAPGLRTKLLEALGVAEPPIWDLCGLVHGPLQSFFDGPRLLFVLEASDAPGGEALRRRLTEVLDPARHRVHVVGATLPSPLCFFEWAAAFDAIVLDALRARPRDLADWPGKGRDGPLYGIDGEGDALG
ncbi:MAG: hypothetical protein KF782_08300 [Labilithrix sp.]|nr:hypothetical protein [Labilithrix sp.]